ncbi:MAG: HAMP domain-containing sensor histidine kinase [Vicinamibacterales bacterium]
MHATRRALRNRVEWLLVGIGLSIAAISWFGYHAIQEWRDSSVQQAERRSNEAADLLMEALTRDMRGVQVSVLTGPDWEHFDAERPYELTTLVASAFARYPYPETFFAWNSTDAPERMTFFNRADRRPAWMKTAAGPSRFPVIIEQQAVVAQALTSGVNDDARRGRRVSVIEIEIGGRPYQVVAGLGYTDAFRDRLRSVVGFTVDLSWARQHYVNELARQVWTIGGGDEKGLTLSVRDNEGRQVAGTPLGKEASLTTRRQFSLTFFDPDSVPEFRKPSGALWTVEVSAENDPTLSQAIRGANRTVLIGLAAAVALVVGLALTARAERSSHRLAELRSDFVATVTHELKTPIATIRAAAETLARGRVSGSDSLRDYGEIVIAEAKHLNRLVENLLAYSRIADVADVYTFHPLDIRTLLEDVRSEFETQIDEGGFMVTVEAPADLPSVHGDRTALMLLFNNLMDNAIRYSSHERAVRLTGHAGNGLVIVAVVDRGDGIEPDELGTITKRFVRGRRAQSGGHGLGLAIAARIAEDHGGGLSLTSTIGEGTTVSVTLRAAT